MPSEHTGGWRVEREKTLSRLWNLDDLDAKKRGFVALVEEPYVDLLAATPLLVRALKRLKAAALNHFEAGGEEYAAIEEAQAALVAAGDPDALETEREWERLNARAALALTAGET